MSHEEFRLSYKEHIFRRTKEVSPSVRSNTKAIAPSQTTDGAPWHQRPEEPDRAYEAFTMFLDMGSDRDMGVLSEILYGNAEATARVEGWSRKWRWTERAEAWDRWLSETRNTQMERAVEESEKLALRFLPRVTLELAEISAGMKEGSRQQVTAIKDFMSRFGPAQQQSQAPVNVNNFQVSYPRLSEKETAPLEAEDADFEVISEHANALIPASLQEKRR